MPFICSAVPSKVVSKVTGLVTPRKVISPTTSKRLTPTGSTRLLTKVDVGIVFDVELILAAQHVVSTRVVGVDARHVDLGLDP